MTNQGPAQGSTFSISYLVPEGVDYRKDIDSILKSMDQQMSLWVENSEISRLNRGDSVSISNEFQEVILKSIYISELTNGDFDHHRAADQSLGFFRGNAKGQHQCG